MTDRTAVVAPLTDWSAAVRARSRIGHTLEVHDSIGSTNDRARELLLEPGGDGSVVLAEVQTAGRGRRGRTWVSPSGLNLTLTVALRPALSAPDAWQLGLAAALATLEACRNAVAGSGLGARERRWLVIFLVLGSAYLAFLIAERLLGVLGGFGTVVIILFLSWLLAFVVSPLIGWIEDRTDLPRSAIVVGTYVVGLV
ncbi:MAG: hypothetical protein LC799_09890, partial [Actinobacteria bacterium]|nr:hypothetical protein [Actinomycetota bacterium]